MFPVTVHTKVTFFHFENLKFNKKKTCLKINILAYGNIGIANILQMANRSLKWTEIEHSGVLAQHIWDTVDLIVFNVILR